MKKLAIITSDEQAELLDYDRDIINLLSQNQIQAEPVIWDKPVKPWEDYEMLLMRTAWGYNHKPEEFRAMLDYFEQKELNVWNPASVMKENMHKFYLKSLMNEGFDVIPTMFLEPEDIINVFDIAGRTGWDKFVIKPAISASAFDTYNFSDINSFRENGKILERFKGKQFLLQKYMEEIETDGEWSIIFFNNGYSYSILKIPQNGEYRIQIEYGGKYYKKQAPELVYYSAKKISDFYIDNCLYIRVDGVVSDNKFYVMEVEMIEPHLFMDLAPEAKEPFVDAIIKKLNGIR